MKRLLCLLAALAVLLPRGHAAEPRCVALTFDDGPSGALTERLLDGLAARGVHATFFLCGYRIDLYPELAARIAAEGHETGTHGDAHSYFTSMSRAEGCRDLAEARRKLMEATGRAPTLLRPPGGLYDTAVLQQTACADLPVILWSVDPEDWRVHDADAVTAHILRHAEPGSVILMHDLTDSSVTAALRVIDALQAQGYEFLTVSELAARSAQAGSGILQLSAVKNASMSVRDAASEPCTKPGFPPPRPCSAALSRFTRPRRSPDGSAMA